ncbi:hypothetical protein WQQ_03520 [Hydrocarboniphaga effusa AP103]|uniref:Uncharacterized protein n=1 Tax=Hydrocarboniphaga effusa AP103 TaxID=1172194 RepID=I8T8C9_9GAMM|nr:hypothetical protein WQQ_01650 [Hydrocarboniphaga effusa AP103]EIT70215.1 hypothetical protein WQQ_03520 [Hydrocarboniphaga effusa AP103]
MKSLRLRNTFRSYRTATGRSARFPSAPHAVHCVHCLGTSSGAQNKKVHVLTPVTRLGAKTWTSVSGRSSVFARKQHALSLRACHTAISMPIHDR